MSERNQEPTLINWRCAVRESELDSTAKLVARTIDSYMDATGKAWPSRATIALGASLAVRTIERAVRRIERAGLLAVDRSHGGRVTNTYQAVLDGVPVAAVRSPSRVTESPQQRHRDAAQNLWGVTGDAAAASRETPEIDHRNSYIVEGDDEFEAAIEPLGPLTRKQRAEAWEAWQRNKDGVRALIYEALSIGIKSPAAFFASRLNEIGKADEVSRFLAQNRARGSWPTGYRYTRGQISSTYVLDPLGYDTPDYPAPFARPSRGEIAAALAQKKRNEEKTA